MRLYRQNQIAQVAEGWRVILIDNLTDEWVKPIFDQYITVRRRQFL